VSKTGKNTGWKRKCAASSACGKTEHDGTKARDATSELVKASQRCFRKARRDERLIFIDVNTDPHPDVKGAFPEWTTRRERLEQYEKQQLQQARAPI